jgi:hypothetical protein
MPRAAFNALLAVLLLLAASLGCEKPPAKLDPNQAKFKALVEKALGKQSKAVIPLLSQAKPSQAVQDYLDQEFQEAIDQGKPFDHDLVVLDSRATVLGWRGPDPDDLTQTYQGYVGQNYAHFEKFKPVFQDKRITSFEIYTQYGPGFGICTPLAKGGDLLGALCLGYDADTLRNRHGLSAKALLAIDFNQ